MNDCISASFENVNVGFVFKVTKMLFILVLIGLYKVNWLLANGIQVEGCPEQL